MDKKFISCTPELWGGIECSFNRVGDLFMDQLQYCGHYERGPGDIERFTSLGIKGIRYPLIWEKHQPVKNGDIDWKWTERQLNMLHTNKVKIIAGLMHHGNGPAYTDLLNDSFPDLFAGYAGRVAEKFPWLTYYTPINEPLTTARFSGLYGLWHPHGKADRDFAIILLNQMKATVLAMHTIRKVNSEASLLQSEDLGKTYSTPLLQYQADFENERRWLTYDILTGRFRPGHALWDFFKALEIPDHLLNFFQDNFCAPAVIGADHYLTSERFLDENHKRYPHHHLGGNHKHKYVDVEAVRVRHHNPSGLKLLLKECWDRYRIPIVVTEVHINGPAEDQIRWFKEVWDHTIQLNEEGVNILAVTSWALLGSFGWNNLLTVPHGHYEQGAYHLNSGRPEPTALAFYLKALSQNPAQSHVALSESGWWQNAHRFLHRFDTVKSIELSA